MRMMRSSLGWIFGLAVVGLVVWVGAVAVAYLTIPDGNTEAQRFDAVIVLGTTAAPDGTPSPELRERVEEGVRQYRAGAAPHLIMTGGAAHNQYAEGHVMALLAESEGVPKEAIVEEDQAQNTIQNIWYSRHIMEERGWRSAEVVSSPYHLPRTALILREYRGTAEEFRWRTHRAHWPPEYGLRQKAPKVIHEAIGCLRLREHGFSSRRFFPPHSGSGVERTGGGR